jgi:hypothetical protein
MTDMTDNSKNHKSAKEIAAYEAAIKKGLGKNTAKAEAFKGKVISQLGGKTTGKTITALPSKAAKITNSVPAAAQGGKKGGVANRANVATTVQKKNPNLSR